MVGFPLVRDLRLNRVFIHLLCSPSWFSFLHHLQSELLLPARFPERVYSLPTLLHSPHSSYGFFLPFSSLSRGYKRSFIIFWLPSRSSLVSCYLVGDFVFFFLLLSYSLLSTSVSMAHPYTVPLLFLPYPNRLWLQSFAKALITLHQLQRSSENLQTLNPIFVCLQYLFCHSHFSFMSCRYGLNSDGVKLLHSVKRRFRKRSSRAGFASQLRRPLEAGRLLLL